MEYAQLVSEGAALLDSYRADGWRTRINTRTLEMRDPEHCVLGQVFGSYRNAPDDIRLHEAFAGLLNLIENWAELEALHEAWVVYLTDWSADEASA